MCYLNQKILSEKSLWLEPISKEKTLYPKNGESCKLDFLVDQLNDETLLDTQNPSLSFFEEELNNDILFGFHWVIFSLFVTISKWLFYSSFITQPIEVGESSNDGVNQTESATSENLTQSAGLSRDITSADGENPGDDGDDPFSNKGLMAGSHYHDYVSFLDWLLEEEAASLSNSQVDWLVHNGENYGLIIQFNNSARISVILPWTYSLLSVERRFSGNGQIVVYSRRNDRQSEFTRDRGKMRNNILGILNGSIQHVGSPASLFSEPFSQENSGESAQPSNRGPLLPIVLGLIGSVFAARASGFQFPQRRRSQRPNPSLPYGIIPSEVDVPSPEENESHNGITTFLILICTTIFADQIRRNRGPNSR